MLNGLQLNTAPANRGIVAIIAIGLLGIVTELTTKPRQTDLSTKAKTTNLRLQN